MYYPIVSIKGLEILESRGTYIGDRICVISRNQGLGIVYIPTGDEASEVIPHGLNGRLPIWIEQSFDGLGHELGEMFQGFQIVRGGFGMCRFVPWRHISSNRHRTAGKTTYSSHRSICTSYLPLV